jgi:tetratricopeptide (TPR) repeat protein
MTYCAGPHEDESEDGITLGSIWLQSGIRNTLGDTHPSTLTFIKNYGSLLQAQGKLSDAEPLLLEAMQGNRNTLGDTHPETLISINNYGTLLRAQGKLSDAEPLLLEAVQGNRNTLGDTHPPCGLLVTAYFWLKSGTSLPSSISLISACLLAQQWLQTLFQNTTRRSSPSDY